MTLQQGTERALWQPLTTRFNQAWSKFYLVLEDNITNGWCSASSQVFVWGFILEFYPSTCYLATTHVFLHFLCFATHHQTRCPVTTVYNFTHKLNRWSHMSISCRCFLVLSFSTLFHSRHDYHFLKNPSIRHIRAKNRTVSSSKHTRLKNMHKRQHQNGQTTNSDK